MSGDSTAALELPIGVTESRVMQQIARIESQLRKAQNGAEQNFIRSNQRVVNSFKPIETAASGMSRATRASLQNVGYQVQDTIVQIQGGQGAVRALSQQMPQLLSGFGLVGVALGTLAPLFIGVAAAIFASGNSAEDAEKQIKALASAISELEAAQKRSSTSSADLAAQFGPMAQQARELYTVQQRLAQLNLTRELNKTAAMVSGNQFSGIGDGTAEQFIRLGEAADEFTAKMNAARTARDTFEVGRLMRDFGDVAVSIGIGIDRLDGLREMFGLTYTEAGKLAAAIASLRDARGANDIANAAAALRDRLSEALSTMDGTNESAVKLVEQLLSAEDAALRAQAVDMAGNISLGADQAKRMADELARALSNANSLAAAGLNDLRVAQINNQYRNDPVGRAGALATLRADQEISIPAGAEDRTVARIEAQRAAYIGAARAAAELNEQTRLANDADRKAAADANRKGRSGGRDRQDPVSRVDDETAALRVQAEAFAQVMGAGGNWSRELDILQQRQKMLNDAQRQGIAITPEYVAEVEAAAAAFVDAKDSMSQMQSEISTGEDALRSFFGSILEGADSAKRALANLLMEIAKAQFSKGMMSLLGGTSLGGGLVQTLGGLLGRRAGGGGARAGQPYLVNEQTPNSEIFVPSSSGAVLNVGQAQRALRQAVAPAQSGGGTVTVIAQHDPGIMVQVIDSRVSSGIARNNRMLSDRRYLTGGV